MSTTDRESRIQSLLDKQEIHEALLRYCRGVDRADRELVLSAFHPDASDDHGDFQTTPAALADRIVANAGRWKYAHFVGNHLIAIEGDVAASEAYFVSFTTLTRDGRLYTNWRGARYVDRFERRNGEWKIAARKVIDDWGRSDAVTEPLDQVGNPGQRSKADPIYALLEQVGFSSSSRPVERPAG